jgi:hypothetical protein
LLADSLLEEHLVSESVELVEEAITIYEEVSELRPSGHWQHAQAVSDLGRALERFCVDHGEERPWPRGQQCIKLLRESLDLHPPGHPLRDQSLHVLARAVTGVKHQDESKRIQLIAESISLNREVLQLRPDGHLERYKTLNNLGGRLSEMYEMNGSERVLEEAVLVQRQVVYTCYPGHPLRDIALNNLAVSLRAWFEHRGGFDRLIEAISLLREALLLRPTGHLLRYQTLDNLAWAIDLRALFQGRFQQFFESTALRREALELLSATHPARSRIMANLSKSLMHAIKHGCAFSGEIAEVIHLQREALRLRRLQGRPLDEDMCELAVALASRFEMSRENADLLEAISLQRESLQLRAPGNWRRFESLQRLANLLSRPECQQWSEALTLYRESLELCPSGSPNRALLLSDMSRCFLELSSPLFDLSEGICLLSEAHSDQFCHVNLRLRYAVSNLRRIEEASSVVSRDPDARTGESIASQILNLYFEVIGLLPRAANLGLDHSTRLQAVAGSDEISRNAAARAVRLGRLSHAVETLEEGRGVFWSQTLHLRAAGLDGVPHTDRQELERLLQLLDFSTRRAQGSEFSVAQRERDLESRRKLNEEVEALITTIRGYPGLARFLMPAAFSDLISALPDGYVVILNSSTLGQHALLLNRATGLATSLELQACHKEFDSDTIRSQVDRNAVCEENNESIWDDTRAMKLSVVRLRSLDDTLALLWHSIVRPVVEELHLEVCATRTTVN